MNSWWRWRVCSSLGPSLERIDGSEQGGSFRCTCSRVSRVELRSKLRWKEQQPIKVSIRVSIRVSTTLMDGA